MEDRPNYAKGFDLRLAGPESPAADIGRRYHAGAWHDEIYHFIATDLLDYQRLFSKLYFN